MELGNIKVGINNLIGEHYLGNFFNVDVRFLMNEMEDESVDLIVSDPPYLINYQSNRRVATEKFEKMQGDKDEELIKWYFKECYRVLKNNKSIYIFCSWKTIDFFKPNFEEYFNLKNVLVWNKGHWGSGDLKGSYAPQHEFILYGHKGRDTLKGKRHPDILPFKKIPAAKLLHPAQKPIQLLRFLICNSSHRGDLVFDGFAGVGSTGFACRISDRKYLMSEIDKTYYTIGKDMISPDNLFVGEWQEGYNCE